MDVTIGAKIDAQTESDAVINWLRGKEAGQLRTDSYHLRHLRAPGLFRGRTRCVRLNGELEWEPRIS
jgi:hypothetical protein